MEAASGFSYLIWITHMRKLPYYLNEFKCFEERNPVCFFEMIKKAIMPIIENERLCYEIKRDLIEDKFKTIEKNHNGKMDYLWYC